MSATPSARKMVINIPILSYFALINVGFQTLQLVSWQIDLTAIRGSRTCLGRRLRVCITTRSSAIDCAWSARLSFSNSAFASTSSGFSSHPFAFQRKQRSSHKIEDQTTTLAFNNLDKHPFNSRYTMLTEATYRNPRF